MNHLLGVLIETMVAALLLVTIGYCVLLNKRLNRLRSDEHSLKAVIAELITATEIAERAIGGLKHAVRDVNENLGNQLSSATQMSEQLRRQLVDCDRVVNRLSKITIAARPQGTLETELPSRTMAPTTAAAPAPRVSGAKAVAAAAQAFSERRRSGGLAA